MQSDPEVSPGPQKRPFDQLHINQVLGRHDLHPYDPEMNDAHPCYAENRLFYECASQESVAGLPLHMKHVKCFHPFKVDLMKCLTKYKSSMDAMPSSE